MRRTVAITPHKQRTAGSLRSFSKTVARTFPDMSAHLHLQDAAREIDAGRYEGARRHLDAAINSFTPQNVRRHGIHDDVGHTHAKEFMHLAHRHLLLVKDLEDIHAGNEQNAEEHRDRAVNEQEARAMKNAQPDPVGKSDGAAAGPASPQPAGSKQFTSWENIMDTIELAQPKLGSGARFSKLSASLAKRGAKNPDALAAYIGRKKYGAKKFGKLSHATPTAGGVELAAPPGKQYRFKHGWIKLSMDALATHNPAWNPDMPGFGQPSMKAASAHMDAAKKAGPGPTANKHKAFARAHLKALGKSAGKAMRNARPAYMPDQPGFGMASDQNGIELVGPKGYSHGWVYHGPSSDPGHPGQVRTGGDVFGQHVNPRPGSGVTGLGPESRGYKPVSDPSLASLDGKQVHGARADGRGAAVGTFNRHQSTVTDSAGVVHPVTHVDPTWNEYGFKGLKGSHLPPEYQEAIRAFKPPDTAAQKVYDASDQNLRNFIRQHNPGFSWEDLYEAIELSAKTGALATTPHPFGKPGGPGLWHVKGMELPPYVQNIARALLRTGRAKDLSQAIAIAKGATNRWAHGGGNVSPEVRAASTATNADWNAKRGVAHAHSNIMLAYTASQSGGTKAAPKAASGKARTAAAKPAAKSSSKSSSSSSGPWSSEARNPLGMWTAGDQATAKQGEGKNADKHQKHFAHISHLRKLVATGKATPAQKAQLAAAMAALGKVKTKAG